jgi:hypothetical protein
MAEGQRIIVIGTMAPGDGKFIAIRLESPTRSP